MRSQVPRNEVTWQRTRNLRKLLLDVMEDAAGDLETLGERIARARKEAGLTQDQLADLVGVKMRQIQNYEADDSDPYRKIGKIAAATGKTVEWLLRGDEATGGETYARLEAELAEVRRSQVRQEKLLAEILAKRGRRPPPSSD